MADNKRSHNAKIEKNGEYYTEYSTIANEVCHYRDQLKGQIVYCNCDDPAWSNFWKYFHSNFASLGLKRLISTHYQKDTEPSYAMVYDGGNDFDMDAGQIVDIYGNVADVNGEEVFYTAGDFRSDACLRFLRESTVVVTNPPFYLLREYVPCLIRHQKKFLIIANHQAVTYKEIFPLIQKNMLWYGVSIHSGGVDFRIPDDYDTYGPKVFIKGNHHYINLDGIRWFTNLDVNYRHNGLWHKNGVLDNSQAHRYYEGFEQSYPKYNNYDVIEISETKNIPIDYEGVMGVPISWLSKYNPDEFEIIGMAEDNGRGFSGMLSRWDGLNPHCIVGNSKPKYKRLFIRNRHPIKKSDDLGY